MFICLFVDWPDEPNLAGAGPARLLYRLFEPALRG